MSCSMRLALAVICLFIPGELIAAPGVPPIALPPASPAPLVPLMPPSSARSKPSIASLIGAQDYPQSAIEAGEQGDVAVELEVTPAGRVGSCRIVSSSGSAALDRATCRVLQRRARFRPAIDTQGRAIADQVQQKIRWELVSLPHAAIESTIVALVDAEGAVFECADESRWQTCGDADFALGTTIAALGAWPSKPMRYRRMLRFIPGEQSDQVLAPVMQPGERLIYAGSAQVGIGQNGRVTGCVERPMPTIKPFALCSLVRPWLFKIDPGKSDSRQGVWSVALMSITTAP